MPVLPILNENHTKYTVWHYRHVGEVYANPDASDPTSAKQHRSSNLLIAAINLDGSVRENAITFVHQGKRGNLIKLAPEMHGFSVGHIRGDGYVEIAACSFNYMGPGFPLRHLKFVRVFDHEGASTLVGHLIDRVFNPDMPLHVEVEQSAWCVLHPLPLATAQRVLVDVQRLPTMPAPSRQMNQAAIVQELVNL